MSRADPINIVTGADDAFAMPIGVTLYSALSNLERGRSVSLSIMDGGISERNRQGLINVLTVTHLEVQITWLKPDLMQLRSAPSGRMARSTNLSSVVDS